MLAEKIKKTRRTSGLTQRELGIAIGHEGGHYISKLERGLHDPSTDILRAIARALGCTVSYLLGEEATSKTNEAA